jgi:hypothetical protein
MRNLLGLIVLVAIARPALGQAPLAHWEPFVSLPGVTDLSVARGDRSFTATGGGRLFLLDPDGTLRDFARGAGGYATAPAPEAYLTLTRNQRVRGAGCSFQQDDVYALEVASPGVVRVDASGVATPFATLPAGSFPNGIAYDHVGRFGHRLLVTALFGGVSAAVYAIDCRGHLQTVVAQAPAVEGGIAIAPRGFGRFGGWLMAPDELSGRILAIDRDGTVRFAVDSTLAGGQDIGVESLGFVPRRFGRRGAAFLADRGQPGNPHPGTDSVLRVAGDALVAAGVRPGDLLAATEASANTIAIRCRRRCTVRRVADGPAVAHAEGHIVFAR